MLVGLRTCGHMNRNEALNGLEAAKNCSSIRQNIMKHVELLKLLKTKWFANKWSFSSPVLLNYEQKKIHQQYGDVCSSVCWNVKWVKDIRSAQLHAAWLAGGICLTFRDPNRVSGDPWWRSVLRVACLDLFCVPAYNNSVTANPHQQKNWPASGLGFGIPPMNEPFNPLIGSHILSHHESSCWSQNLVTAFTRYESTKQ